MDVASLLEVNHINQECYEIVHVIAFCYFPLAIIYCMNFASVNGDMSVILVTVEYLEL